MKIKNIYIEEKVRNHTNTKIILSNLKYENIIICEHYSEIFNPTNQNFRLQKKNPAIILAKKQKGFIHKSPKNFSIGFNNNYYFSHMLNCIYDCKYCYLQGMFNSANYLIFVNYEDFLASIKQKISENNGSYCFFSGYDCDSLALESVTNFLKYFFIEFESLKNATLEVRSKSININVLKKRKPINNIIPAFSLNPQFIIDNFEDKTPSLQKRLFSIKTLQTHGWNIGLRFDPLIWHGSLHNYEKFFNQIFRDLDIEKIHSVTLGNFRMPSIFLKKLSKQRPLNSFIQYENSKQLFNSSNKNFGDKEKKFCLDLIKKYIESSKVFLN